MEMPASLYQKAKQYEIVAAELGQNETEQDAMLSRAEMFGAAGKVDEFREQLYNYRLARVMAKDGYQAGQLDWACHVHSVNGEPVTDYSEDNLFKLIEKWSTLGLTQQMIVDHLDNVKKNSSQNWLDTFQSDLLEV
jgi:hypothetical protein